jgi:hypothetical protein
MLDCPKKFLNYNVWRNLYSRDTRAIQYTAKAVQVDLELKSNSAGILFENPFITVTLRETVNRNK